MAQGGPESSFKVAIGVDRTNPFRPSRVLAGRLERLEFESACLKGNGLGDPVRRELFVYVPPGYDDGGRFPVVMVLPGFGSTHRSVFGYSAFKPNTVERFDRLVREGACAPALLVLPDCINRWGGSQFLDSEVGGAYQTYLAEEVVPRVDRSFRTVAERSGRAAVGTSSGGFGALWLGMARPEVCSAIGSHAGDGAFRLSFRPMLNSAAIALRAAGGLAEFCATIDAEGPRNQSEFDALLMVACATAYSPRPEAPFPHVDLPICLDTGELVERVWARWMRHDPLERLADHEDALRSMSLVYLDAGDRDEYGLQFAARSMAEAMKKAGIAVHHEEFSGGHRGTSHRYEISLPRLVDALGA